MEVWSLPLYSRFFLSYFNMIFHVSFEYTLCMHIMRIHIHSNICSNQFHSMDFFWLQHHIFLTYSKIEYLCENIEEMHPCIHWSSHLASAHDAIHGFHGLFNSCGDEGFMFIKLSQQSFNSTYSKLCVGFTCHSFKVNE